jgi:hypothetical protein
MCSSDGYVSLFPFESNHHTFSRFFSIYKILILFMEEKVESHFCSIFFCYALALFYLSPATCRFAEAGCHQCDNKGSSPGGVALWSSDPPQD